MQPASWPPALVVKRHHLELALLSASTGRLCWLLTVLHNTSGEAKVCRLHHACSPSLAGAPPR